jgi:ubiquinone/menaquinone biosynthesis C-methylase UbiE
LEKPDLNKLIEMNSLDILCCPSCKGDLYPLNGKKLPEQNSDEFECSVCHRNFSNAEGYLDLLGDKGLIHSSKREKIVRSIYAKIYTPATNLMFLFCGGVRSARREVLSKLEIKDNYIILETGMGAGENLLWINNIAHNLAFYGIDIQKQMMIHCTKNLKRWNIKAKIYRADAEELPFKDEKFDVVFHLGAINLFSDKKKAIDEMIRVAKPGTKIVIADETEKAGKLFNLFTGSKDVIIPPMDLIPEEMQNKQMNIIWRGYGYVITFVKPPENK